LFGETWLRLIGKRADEIEAESSIYIRTARASLIGMIALALVVSGFGAEGALEGVLAGAVTALGFTATSTYVYSAFEGPPTVVWLLWSAYQLVVYLVMGAVFALF
jgi:hypothetical protein